jgi:hypothetical protein
LEETPELLVYLHSLLFRFHLWRVGDWTRQVMGSSFLKDSDPILLDELMNSSPKPSPK